MYCSRISFGLLQGKIVVTEDDMEGGINLIVRQVTECYRVSHEYGEQDTLCILFFRILCSAFFVTAQFPCGLALHQGLKTYSSWPTFLKFYIDGEFFGGQLQRATSLSCELFCERYVLSSIKYSNIFINLACSEFLRAMEHAAVTDIGFYQLPEPWFIVGVDEPPPSWDPIKTPKFDMYAKGPPKFNLAQAAALLRKK
ncbi:hypothetical protein ZWY2020_019363 [Hordeum vulgare]|nr:hypothetical protein ZWY2020_019363 [Hordeum vulgare]